MKNLDSNSASISTLTEENKRLKETIIEKSEIISDLTHRIKTAKEELISKDHLLVIIKCSEAELKEQIQMLQEQMK